jgi:glycosyltransferase involved in cell wall biosynthesis
MAARLPVIATRSGGPLDFVVETGPSANGWFCKVDDVESLAETVQQAVGDEAERTRRGDNALTLVRSAYDWEEIARQYVELYDEVVQIDAT